MEDLIPFLIIVISGIISFIASGRKDKSKKTAEETFEFNNESIENEEDFQNQQQSEDQEEYSRFFGETVEERKQALTEEEEEPAEKPTQKPPASATNQQQRDTTNIETISDRFDVEEAIIYSEIINRKHF